jgi:hypothetical protein
LRQLCNAMGMKALQSQKSTPDSSYTLLDDLRREFHHMTFTDVTLICKGAAHSFG